jgi:hypothetical protein
VGADIHRAKQSNTKNMDPQKEVCARKDKLRKQIYLYFIMNDENAITLEYFSLRTNAV